MTTTTEQLDLITFEELQGLLRLGRSAARERTHREDFPHPFQLGDACYRWDRGEVMAWLRAQQKPLPPRAARQGTPKLLRAAEAVQELPVLVAVPRRGA